MRADIETMAPGGRVCVAPPVLAGDAPARSIGDYLGIVWRRRYLALGVIATCTLAAYTGARFMRPVYRAAISIVVEKKPGIDLFGGQPGPDAAAAEAQFQTELELLQSRSVVRRALSKLNDGSWSDNPAKARSPRERELAYAKQSLKIIPVKGSYLIRVQVDAHDAQLAAALANTLVSERIAVERERQTATNEFERKWLDSQIATLRGNIENVERQMFAFADAADPDASAAGEDGDASDPTVVLHDQLVRARVERVNAAAHYEVASKAAAGANAELNDSPRLRELDTRLVDLQRQLAEATALWTKDHPKVRQLSAQVKLLTAMITSEQQNALARMQGEYAAALRKEQLLADEYLRVARVAAERKKKGIQYSLLRRDLDRDRALYDTVIQKIEQAGIAAGLNTAAIRIVDLAEAPLEPVRPNVALTTYLAFIGSIILGVVVAVTRENLASTLNWPGESAVLLNVNELGAIPSYAKTQWRLLKRPRSVSLSLGTAGSSEPERVQLAVLRDAASIAAQSFRAVLASILFAGEGARVIAVTSAAEGEGKTTVVSNLGVTLARMRSRVLLIDADSQRPSLHKAFGIPTAPGLHELLDTESEIVLEQYISETGIAGLQLLQSRHRARTPEPERPEILLSRRISELMRATRQRYDFILIDTPPLLQGADSRIWGQLADGVVLVIRAGSTDRQRATAAVSTLSKDGAVVLGTVLNDLHPSRIQCYEYCRS